MAFYSYSHGRIRHTVHVNHDGSIRVHIGDWLSKYSMAIYWTPFRVREFARRGPQGLRPISNLNLIFAGETLYHVPTYYRSKPEAAVAARPAAAPSAPETPATLEIGLPLTDADKERLALDHLVHEYHLKGHDFEVVSDWLHDLKMTDDVFMIAECIIDAIAVHSAKLHAVMYTGGLITGAFSALITPVILGLEIAHAKGAGRRSRQMAAMAVGITAWAYEEGPPPFLERLRDKIHLDDSDQRADEEVWQDGCRKALEIVDKKLAEFEPHIRALRPGQANISRDQIAHVLRKLLQAIYGSRERMAIAVAKTIVEAQKSISDRELRPHVLYQAGAYFNPDFNIRDAE
jgi:hypothetical protein